MLGRPNACGRRAAGADELIGGELGILRRIECLDDVRGAAMREPVRRLGIAHEHLRLYAGNTRVSRKSLEQMGEQIRSALVREDLVQILPGDGPSSSSRL